MKYSYQIVEVAGLELLEAALWYENKKEGLGDEFILCFEGAVNDILLNPFQFQLRHKKLRLANLERFPYYVVFFVEEKLITIVACFHVKRNPRIWKRRIKR